ADAVARYHRQFHVANAHVTLDQAAKVTHERHAALKRHARRRLRVEDHVLRADGQPYAPASAWPHGGRQAHAEHVHLAGAGDGSWQEVVGADEVGHEAVHGLAVDIERRTHLLHAP